MPAAALQSTSLVHPVARFVRMTTLCALGGVATVTAFALAGCNSASGTAGGAATSGKAITIRAAVIGGMTDTGFWDALVERFEKSVGHRYAVQVVAHGPKHIIGAAFRQGDVDLITMHASDTIINLVADGFAADPQPWLKNDLVIVGPASDPAGIRGLPSARLALQHIADKRAPFVAHASLGAQEVLRDVLQAGEVFLPSDRLEILFSDRAPEVLRIAAEKGAYTLIGRIPFRNGKLPNAGMEIMVQGDPALRRPYVVAIAARGRVPDEHRAAAAALSRFMTSPETQDWVKTYGVGQLDDKPLFFPVFPQTAESKPGAT